MPDTAPGTGQSTVNSDRVIMSMTVWVEWGWEALLSANQESTTPSHMGMRAVKESTGCYEARASGLRPGLMGREGFHKEAVLRPRSEGDTGGLDKCRWREGGQTVLQAEHKHHRPEVGRTCSYRRKTWKAAWVSGLQSRAGVAWHQASL